MPGKMADNRPGPARGSLAEGSASSLEHISGPRLRQAPQNTNNSLNPGLSHSDHPFDTTTKSENKSTDNSQDMGSTNILPVAHRLMPTNLTSVDSFGPIYYNAGEVFLPTILGLVASIGFCLLGMFTAVIASLCGIAFIQTVKFALDKKFLKDSVTKAFWIRRFGNLQSLLEVALDSMTIAMFLLPLVLANFGFAPFWILCIVTPFFLVGQCIYWPLHGYLLHKNITVHRPQHREELITSIEGAQSNRFSYNCGKFLLIFAGSGGHTTEMLNLMKLYEPYDESMFRRYIVTSGDKRSEDDIRAYEDWRKLKRASKLNGFYDVVYVSRARYVGQSWLTTPFTAIKCLYDCYRILKLGRLLVEPGQPDEFPQTVVCNGPGSSVTFVLVAHLMRMYGLIPLNRCTTLFVESVARVKSLSLTGKLFYYLDLADAFITQHEQVGESYPRVTCEKVLVKRVYTQEDFEWPHMEDVVNDIRDDS